jgi:hypothetical protein
MIYECPNCGGMMPQHGGKQARSYGLYIRWQCKDCGHAECQGRHGPPNLKPHPAIPVNRRKFDAALIAEIRQSSQSAAAIAARYGCAVTTIRRIKRGTTYQDADQYQRSCHRCRFWNFELGRCREGWPDPLTDGPSYANECDDYSRVEADR